VKLLKVPFALSLGEKNIKQDGADPSSNNGKALSLFPIHRLALVIPAISDVYYGGKRYFEWRP